MNLIDVFQLGFFEFSLFGEVAVTFGHLAHCGFGHLEEISDGEEKMSDNFVRKFTIMLSIFKKNPVKDLFWVCCLLLIKRT